MDVRQQICGLQVCRATVRLIASWPIMDAKISDSTLVRMAGGSVLLDAERVWRPRVMVDGARNLQLMTRRLELQSVKSVPPHRNLLQQKSEADFGAGNEAASTQGNSARRPVYVMIEV